jgi:AcrR family transcriptional regulator
MDSMSGYEARPRTKAGQREATIRALVAEARSQFASRGYANVSLTEIVEATGVTKGALYHHFANKEDLFRSVLQEVQQAVADRIATAAPESDLWTQLIAGCEMFLSVSTEPETQQIMLIDAPSVLGWGAWREIDAATSMQQLEHVLLELMEQGVIRRQPVAPLVHLLSGAMNEAALWIAHSDDRERHLAQTMGALTQMLDALREE